MVNLNCCGGSKAAQLRRDEDLRTLAAGALPVISTDFVTTPPTTYQDNRTLIHIWGERTLIYEHAVLDPSVHEGGLRCPTDLDAERSSSDDLSNATGLPPQHGDTAQQAGGGPRGAQKRGSGMTVPRRAGSVLSQGSQSSSASVVGTRHAEAVGAGVRGPSETRPLTLTSLDGVKIKQVACGTEHMLLLSAGGQVYSFGTGRVGQLGLGHARLFVTRPELVPSLSRIVQVTAGNLHSLVLNESGELFTWGAADCQGDKFGTDHHLPKQIDPQNFGSTLSNEVNLKKTAKPPYDFPKTPLRRGSKNAETSAYNEKGDKRVAAVREWESSSTSSSTTSLSGGEGVEALMPGALITRISSRFDQSMAITRNNEVYVWGNTFFSHYYAVPHCHYGFPAEDKIVDVSIGKQFALALSASGKVFAWGDGTYGELGRARSKLSSLQLTRSPIPREILLSDTTGALLPRVVAVASGARHSLLLGEDGGVWAFGDNLAGQCGVPWDNMRFDMLKPVRMFAGDRRLPIKSIACGLRHSGAITENNQLLLWGHSAHHKLIHTAPTSSLLEERFGITAGHMGIAVPSGIKDCCGKPKLVYSMLHSKVICIGLAEEFTVVVTGEGRISPPVSPTKAQDECREVKGTFFDFTGGVSDADPEVPIEGGAQGQTFTETPQY